MCVVFVVFFVQAEDGIRDLVRSRGLGDVYKRQRRRRPDGAAPLDVRLRFPVPPPAAGVQRARERDAAGARARRPRAVSYTHLTLPTSDLV